MAVNAKVASAYIDLVARTEAFKKAMDDATGMMRKFSSETRAQMAESKASIAMLGEAIGIHIPRHLQTVINKLPGVSAAMTAAFAVGPILLTIKIVGEAVEKVVEFAKKNEEAARKNAEAWDSISKPLTASNDQLRVTNDKLENAIAKMEHKPQNGLKLAIDEAVESADKLGMKLDQDLNKLDEVLKKNAPGLFGGQLFKGEAGTEDVQMKYADLQSRIRETASEGNARIRGARGSNDPAALKAAQDDLNNKLSALYTEGSKFAQSVLDSARLAQAAQANPEKYPMSYRTGFNSQNMDARLRAGSGLLDFFGSQQDTLDLQAKNSRLTKTKDILDAGEQAAKDQAAATRLYIESSIADYKLLESENQRVLDAVGAEWDKGQKGLRVFEEDLGHTGERWKQYNVEVAKGAQQQAIMSARFDELTAKTLLSTGAINPHAAAIMIEAAHVEQYRTQLDALNDSITRINEDSGLSTVQKATQIQGIQNQKDQLGGAQKIQQLEDAVAVFDITWKGMVDGVFDEVIRKSQQAGQEIRKISEQMIDAVNTELAKGMTGQKMDFGKVFESGAQQLAKVSLQKAEGIGLQLLGIKHKQADGYHVFVDNLPGGGLPDLPGIFGGTRPHVSGPGGSGLASAASNGLLSILNSSNWASSLFGGKLFGAGSFFGGGHALGGAVAPGVPIDVGELGRERFTPMVAGTITPHNQMSDQQTIMNIDARGTDPALTRENFQNALAATHRQATRDAAMITEERNRRIPH